MDPDAPELPVFYSTGDYLTLVYKTKDNNDLKFSVTSAVTAGRH